MNEHIAPRVIVVNRQNVNDIPSVIEGKDAMIRAYMGTHSLRIFDPDDYRQKEEMKGMLYRLLENPSVERVEIVYAPSL